MSPNCRTSCSETWHYCLQVPGKNGETDQTCARPSSFHPLCVFLLPKSCKCSARHLEAVQSLPSLPNVMLVAPNMWSLMQSFEATVSGPPELRGCSKRRHTTHFGAAHWQKAPPGSEAGHQPHLKHQDGDHSALHTCHAVARTVDLCQAMQQDAAMSSHALPCMLTWCM